MSRTLPYLDVHRSPGEESLDLYPGLVVSDGEQSRQGGSITVGRTRLPVWAFIGEVIRDGWASGTGDYYDFEDGEVFGQAAVFFCSLLDHRGEFGRLILLLADAERCSTVNRHWTQTRRHRRRLADQLRRCLAVLESEEDEA